MSPEATVLHSADLTARIEVGQLRSLQKDGYEYMHQPDEPGWGHSDTEMFPIIGPTAEAGYRVQVPRGNAVLDQHGLLRELPCTPEKRSPAEAVWEKQYQAGTPVPNSKYPGRSQARFHLWPYTFGVRKFFTLEPDSLQIRFEVEGERDMPYMLGYHPAFRVSGTDFAVLAGDRSISLEEIMTAGDRALEIPECEELQLLGPNPVAIRTSGFGQFMLWSPDPGMLCVEPVTYYPYSLPQAQLHEGFRYLTGQVDEFSVEIRPHS